MFSQMLTEMQWTKSFRVIDSSLIFLFLFFTEKTMVENKSVSFRLEEGYDKIRFSPLQYKTPRPRKTRFPSTKYWFFLKKLQHKQTEENLFNRTLKQTGHASLWSSWTSCIKKGNRVTNYWEVKLRKLKVRNNTNVLIRIRKEIEC